MDFTNLNRLPQHMSDCAVYIIIYKRFGLLVAQNKHCEVVTLGSEWWHFSLFSEFSQTKQSIF